MSKPTISPETANHVLWHFCRGGYRPGDFTVNLMQAWNAADPANAARLAIAFPELCAALTLANYTEDGVMELRRIAEGETHDSHLGHHVHCYVREGAHCSCGHWAAATSEGGVQR